MDDLMNAHVLMPAALIEQIPAPYETERHSCPVAQVKWFTPDADWTWYVVEYDPKDRTAFGLVAGFEIELGYFSLDEIEAIRGPLGLRVERDLYFKPQTISKCRADHHQADTLSTIR